MQSFEPEINLLESTIDSPEFLSHLDEAVIDFLAEFIETSVGPFRHPCLPFCDRYLHRLTVADKNIHH